MNKIIVACVIFFSIVVINYFVNPQYIEDKTKSATECHNDQWTGFNICSYPKHFNENNWLGYLVAGIAVILYFALMDQQIQPQILTMTEVWNEGIPSDDKVNFKIPPLSLVDSTWFVPKYGGTVALARYKEMSVKSARIDHYIALDMTSDRKALNTTYSRKSAMIAHIAEIVPWSQAQQMSQSGTKDLASQAAIIEKKIEALIGQKSDITKGNQSLETLKRQKEEIKQKIDESDENEED